MIENEMIRQQKKKKKNNAIPSNMVTNCKIHEFTSMFRASFRKTRIQNKKNRFEIQLN